MDDTKTLAAISVAFLVILALAGLAGLYIWHTRFRRFKLTEFGEKEIADMLKMESPEVRAYIRRRGWMTWHEFEQMHGHQLMVIDAILGCEAHVDSGWKQHAYPLQQIVVKVQGTRHSTRESLIQQLEVVLKRIKAGEEQGQAHDDDFGYTFDIHDKSLGPSFFHSPSGLY